MTVQKRASSAPVEYQPASPRATAASCLQSYASGRRRAGRSAGSLARWPSWIVIGAVERASKDGAVQVLCLSAVTAVQPSTRLLWLSPLLIVAGHRR